MSKQQGMTWLELVFVLIIIAVAAAILFPVFAPGGVGGGPNCASHEEGLGSAFMQYAEDNNNQYPDGAVGGGVGWAGQVSTYLHGTRGYRCPDDTYSAKPPQYVVSYGMNSNLSSMNIKHIALPSHTILIFEVAHDTADVKKTDEGWSKGARSFSAAGDGTDGTLRSGSAQAIYATGWIGNRPQMNAAQEGKPRHEGGANYAFADGHVKWLLPAQVSSGRCAASSREDQTGTVQGTAAGTQNKRFTATFSVK